MDMEKTKLEREISLLLASENADIVTVRALIAAGADVNVQNERGETPLHKATSDGYMEMVQFLIEAGADINARNCGGETPLHIATSNGFREMVQFLIEAGADVNASKSGGETPLHIATSEGYREMVHFLIEAGADVNASKSGGETPLHIATSGGYWEMVQCLIEAGADVNASKSGGETPLHIATSDGYMEMVQFLIEAGGDINAVNDYGETVLCNVQLRSISELLVSHIVRLQAAGLYVSEKNLKKMDEFMNTRERRNKYLQHSIVCKEEVNKLKRENFMLYRFLTESEIACSNFNNPENLKDQYPEYAYILINEAKVRKENFLHNHRQLVDALSIHYECDVKRMTFAGMKHFFNFHSFDFKEKLGSGGLTLCSFVDFQDVKERHIPKLKALAFETFLSKCCTKKKSKFSNH